MTGNHDSSFERHPLADERLSSAVTLVKALLQMPGLIREHRRDSEAGTLESYRSREPQ